MTCSSQPTRIKICGITNLDDARCAAEAGADFLGFIFYAQSPRFVAPERVAAIAQALRGEFGTQAPRLVGVFVNESAGRVQTILDATGLDLAQLHGHESPEVVQKLHPRAFKAIRPQTRDQAKRAIAAYGNLFLDDEAVPQLLIDAYHPRQFGGTGIQANLTVARVAAQHCRLLLAGGLAPGTVGTAIEQAQPWGVDVSSGVERAKGIKDHVKIRAFVRAIEG